jgi:hypothetical protein
MVAACCSHLSNSKSSIKCAAPSRASSVPPYSFWFVLPSSAAARLHAASSLPAAYASADGKPRGEVIAVIVIIIINDI